MLLSEWIRRTAYWSLDLFKGSKVRKHFIDIKHIMESMDSPDVLKEQQLYLDSLLKYATENVAFYKEFKGYSSLESFPIINKTIVKNNFDAFQSPEFIEARVHNMHTSGSTGTPFLVRQDLNKRNRVYAEMIYFWGKAGYQLGMRYIFLRIWTSVNRKGRLSALARNIVMWNILHLDDGNLENIRKTLRSDRRIKMILGYASTFENLANYLMSCGDTPQDYHIQGIISGAEFLTEATREKLTKVFNCPIVSVYSNQENGLLAEECLDHQEFHVNSASYHIEILKFDSNEPADTGEAGRIVVTDLFNHAMPLIRYDTGDIAIGKKKAECGWNSQVFSSVEGGLVDFIFDTAGNRISPHTVSVVMWPYDKLKQFQFVQTDARKYILKLNGNRNDYADDMFVRLFKDVLGKDAEISIEYVDEIPILNSGKRKIVVSTYLK